MRGNLFDLTDELPVQVTRTIGSTWREGSTWVGYFSLRDEERGGFRSRAEAEEWVRNRCLFEEEDG